MKNFVKKNNLKKGFMMVEIIIASSIMVIVIIATMAVIQKGLSLSRQSLHGTQAAFLLEEGGEAVRIIRDTSWANISNLSTSLTYYLTLSPLSWIARNASEQNRWGSVVYGNGIFVAVSSDGTNRVMTSPDGITWTSRAVPEANQWLSITYGNGIFVAVSYDGTNRVMTSTDGITWTARATPISNNWNSVKYGNGIFVAVGWGAGSVATDKIITSPDGINWTIRTIPLASMLYDSAYGSNVFVVVGVNGRAFSSPDGINWTQRSVGVAGNLYAITYGNGMFVTFEGAGTGGQSLIVSTNGINWSTKSTVQNYAVDISFGNGLFIISDGTSALKTSSDGTNWTNETALSGSAWSSFAYGNGVFVAVAVNGTNRVMTSASSMWTLTTTPNKVDNFTRTVRVANVSRDASTSDIVTSGGVNDIGTRLITINVAWTESGQALSKSLSFYISDIFS